MANQDSQNNQGQKNKKYLNQELLVIKKKVGKISKRQKASKKKKPGKWVDLLFWGIFCYIWLVVLGFFSFEAVVFPIVVVAILIIGRFGGRKYRRNFSSSRRSSSDDLITNSAYSSSLCNIHHKW